MTDLDLDTFTAVMICEGNQDANPEVQLEAWQLLIDTGLCWKLQGCFGRTAAHLISQGLCHEPGEPQNDRLFG